MGDSTFHIGQLKYPDRGLHVLFSRFSQEQRVGGRHKQFKQWVWRVWIGGIPKCEPRINHPHLALTCRKQVYSQEEVMLVSICSFEKGAVERSHFYSISAQGYNLIYFFLQLFFKCKMQRGLI